MSGVNRSGRLMNHFVIGDWMGSLYTAVGKRCDLFLFLDRDGRYERTARMEPDHDVRDAGRWEYDPASRALQLIPDTPDAAVRWSSDSGRWTVLTVSGCEDSNALLVLRPVAPAARNLPVVLYRVHCNGRGYGTKREQSLPDRTDG